MASRVAHPPQFRQQETPQDGRKPPCHRGSKSFLVLFSKKDCLPSFLAPPAKQSNLVGEKGPIPVLIRAAALAVLLATAAQAQPAAPLPTVNTPTPGQPTLPAAQLRQLLAPIALYPDPLLANILAASTYPAQIVEAQRFLADPAQAGQSVDQLTGAAAAHDWDLSVTALLAFPQVLQMLDSNLEWTEHLGRVFTTQQADVFAAVQSLRQLAQQAGALTNGPYDSVVDAGGDIQILPPSAQDVYLPSYNPACVYGPDPACAPDQDQVGWLTDDLLPYGYLQWGSLDWRQHNIRYNDRSRDGAPVWRHGAFASHAHAFNYAPAANQLYRARQVSRPAFRIASPVRPVFRAAPVQRAAPPVAIAHFAGGGRR